MKFELKFRCIIETDYGKDEVSGGFSEDFKQLLAILSKMGMKTISVSDSDVKIGELFDLYVETNNVKEKTRMVYNSCFMCLFGKNYRNLSLSDVSVEHVNVSKYSINTRYFYVSVISSFFNFACKKGLIYENPFEKMIDSRMPQVRRKALNCEDWLFLSDAQREINSLFSGFKWMMKKYKKFNPLFLFLLHMILATRVQETYRVITTCSLTDFSNRYILVETKMTRKGMKPNYRLVLTNLAVFLIQQVQKQIQKFKYSRFYYNLHNVTKSLSNNMDVHGTRSLFRTIVELIPQTQSISFGAKETALGHATKNTVQRKYCRSDYYLKRYELQLYYADFLLQCLDEGIENVAVMRDIVAKDLHEFLSKKPKE